MYKASLAITRYEDVLVDAETESDAVAHLWAKDYGSESIQSVECIEPTDLVPLVFHDEGQEDTVVGFLAEGQLSRVQELLGDFIGQPISSTMIARALAHLQAQGIDIRDKF